MCEEDKFRSQFLWCAFIEIENVCLFSYWPAIRAFYMLCLTLLVLWRGVNWKHCDPVNIAAYCWLRFMLSFLSARITKKWRQRNCGIKSQLRRVGFAYKVSCMRGWYFTQGCEVYTCNLITFLQYRTGVYFRSAESCLRPCWGNVTTNMSSEVSYKFWLQNYKLDGTGRK